MFAPGIQTTVAPPLPPWSLAPKHRLPTYAHAGARAGTFHPSAIKCTASCNSGACAPALTRHPMSLSQCLPRSLLNRCPHSSSEFIFSSSEYLISSTRLAASASLCHAWHPAHWQITMPLSQAIGLTSRSVVSPAECLERGSVSFKGTAQYPCGKADCRAYPPEHGRQEWRRLEPSAHWPRKE